jgi:hypothetical protein
MAEAGEFWYDCTERLTLMWWCSFVTDEGVIFGIWRLNMQDRVEEVLALVQQLSVADQIRFLKDLVTMLNKQGEEIPPSQITKIMELENTLQGNIEAEQQQKTRRSILEFRGMDKESWKDVNVQEYIKQERASWDDKDETKPQPLLDIREFRGIGHGTWTDASSIDKFISEERASWDD